MLLRYLAAAGAVVVLLLHSVQVLYSSQSGGGVVSVMKDSKFEVQEGASEQSNNLNVRAATASEEEPVVPPVQKVATPVVTHIDVQRQPPNDPTDIIRGIAANTEVGAESDRAKSISVKSQLGGQPFKPTSKHGSFCKGVGKKCLPDFWFIGSSKCGTTTMANLLAKHPRVRFAVDDSEAHVFDRADKGNFSRDSAKVQLRGAAEALVDNGKNAQNYRIVEYTPHYLYEPQVAYRLKRTMGDERSKHMKFMVMLREPTARAFSSWVMKKNVKGSTRDKRSFHQAVLDGIAHWDKRKTCIGKAVLENSVGKQRIYSDTCSPSLGDVNPFHAHVEKSLYTPQLEVWFSLFPRENFFFLQLEDFSTDPGFWVQRVIEFMGLEPFGDLGFKNADHIQSIVDGMGKKNTAKEDLHISDEDKFLLNGLFRPYNAELDEMLGWKTGYSTGK